MAEFGEEDSEAAILSLQARQDLYKSKPQKGKGHNYQYARLLLNKEMNQPIFTKAIRNKKPTFSEQMS